MDTGSIFLDTFLEEISSKKVSNPIKNVFDGSIHSAIQSGKKIDQSKEKKKS